MNFIQAVIEIHLRQDLEFCDDQAELNGKHPSICVYKKGEIVGKLRWPHRNYNLKSSRCASVDIPLERELQKEKSE